MFSILYLIFSIPLIYAQECPKFPIIDLGYAKHAPTYTNTTRSNITYATYANIRFAQPPVGNLRFRKPQLPPPSEAEVQNGTYPRNATDCLNSIPAGVVAGVDSATWGSEDCLFLDVKVPEGVQGENVPVLHWLYGGGYFFGSKTWAGDPATLFQDMNPDQKFITVSSNYRLGALGWMSADGVDIDVNNGLWDGLTAVEWTKEYISYFGGDPDRITVIGESAGGGIVEHLVTLRGGNGSVPFSQAIMTSGGGRPHINRSADMTEMYNLFLNASGCSDINCVRNASTDTIANANRQLILDVPSEGWIGPTIGFGPLIDGDLVPDIPFRLFTQGKYHTSVEKVLASNMGRDGQYTIVTPVNDWDDALAVFMASPTESALALVNSTYSNATGTATDDFAGDVNFLCHAYFMAKAFGTDAYRYVMTIPPASHGQDQFYYFSTGPEDPVVDFPDVARQMQTSFRNFILEGRMGGGNCNNTHWPSYGTTGRWMNITADGYQLMQEEDLQARRCELVLRLINDPANGW